MNPYRLREALERAYAAASGTQRATIKYSCEEMVGWKMFTGQAFQERSVALPEQDSARDN